MTHVRRPPLGTQRDPIYISVVESDTDRLGELLTLMRAIKAQGDHNMAQLDDLKAVLSDVDSKVEAISVDAGEIKVKVEDLIQRLGNLPPSPDLAGAIAQAQGISDRLGALDAALDALPSAPSVA